MEQRSIVEVARATATKAKIVQIEQALEFYRLDNSRYPTSEQGLDALLNAPSSAPEKSAKQR